MSFYPELIKIGENLPWFAIKSKDQINIQPNSSVDQVQKTKYQCSVCRKQFNYLTCFIKTCENHSSSLRKIHALAEKEDTTKNEEIDPDDVIVIKDEETDLMIPDELENSIQISEPTTNDVEEPELDTLQEEPASSDDNYEPPSSPEEVQIVKKKRKKVNSKNNRSHLRNIYNDQVKSIRNLPDTHVFYCIQCDRIFKNTIYQLYRDHLLGHQNPLYKCCQICRLQYSSGRAANEHKKEKHPELYRQEMKERKEITKSTGFIQVDYQIIPKTEIEMTKDGTMRVKESVRQQLLNGQSNVKTVNKSNVTMQSREVKLKPFRIVLEWVKLPGFAKNDWIGLPKNFQQILKNRQNKQDNTKIEGNSISIKTHQEKPRTLNSNVSNKHEFDEVKSENIKIEVNPSQVKDENVELEQSDGDDFDWPMETLDEEFDYVLEDTNLVTHDEDNKSNIIDDQIEVEQKADVAKVPRKGRRTILPEEIPDVPDFIGAKYIFDVYKKRGNNSKSNQRKQLKQAKKKKWFDRTKADWEVLKDKNSKPGKKSTKTTTEAQNEKPISYKQERPMFTCEICGEIRNQSNIRRHVAIHCAEEDETKCRICDYSQEGQEKAKYFKMHYAREHGTTFRAYLIKTQKEKMEKGEDNSNNFTCKICYTNMKNEEQLKYHTKMLHEYNTAGGRNPAYRVTGLECTICGKIFKKTLYLRMHIRNYHKHTRPATVYCHYCDKGLATKGDLKCHFVMVHRYRNGEFQEAPTMTKGGNSNVTVICDKCGVFLKKASISKHNCQARQKCLRTASTILDATQNRLAHEKITDLSNLYCHICDVKFRDKIGFRLHIERLGPPKFFCTVIGCEKGFAVKPSLTSHMRNAHIEKGLQVFKCRVCDDEFKNKIQRVKHEKAEHDYVFRKQGPAFSEGWIEGKGGECPYCEKFYDDYERFKNHKYTHSRKKVSRKSKNDLSTTKNVQQMFGDHWTQY
uniref:CSON002114 protein n=1 Tax=Culicoides sonorensis TaxID=179676 RepID=A0A336K727_CULSO